MARSRAIGIWRMKRAKAILGALDGKTLERPVVDIAITASSIYRTRSSSNNSLPVFRTEATMVSMSKGMSVLEIGCGTGMLAIELAKLGAQVTTLDFSKGMLDVFKQNIPDDVKDRITILYEDWYKTNIAAKGWEKKFDLVIAFMSPGVAGPDSFFKMMRCSKKGCAIRGWAAKRKHSILSELWRKIMGIPLEDKPQSILYKINLLFSMGFFPEITFDTIEWEQTVSVEDEFDRQMAFFQKASKKPAAELENIIRRYLDALSTDNYIVRQHKGLTAMVVWKVDEPYL